MCIRLIYLQTCDIMGAVAPYVARNNHTPLRGEQQATIYYDWRRCEKNIVKYDEGILYEFSTTISKFA